MYLLPTNDVNNFEKIKIFDLSSAPKLVLTCIYSGSTRSVRASFMYCDLWPYVWLVFKCGLQWRTYSICTVGQWRQIMEDNLRLSRMRYLFKYQVLNKISKKNMTNIKQVLQKTTWHCLGYYLQWRHRSNSATLICKSFVCIFAISFLKLLWSFIIHNLMVDHNRVHHQQNSG